MQAEANSQEHLPSEMRRFTGTALCTVLRGLTCAASAMLLRVLQLLCVTAAAPPCRCQGWCLMCSPLAQAACGA